MKAIDLFAGLGGWSTGAVMAGCEVLWAANHWQEAVHWHSENHPDTQHICQDLHQADWTQVPSHDLLLASPCCQGHSKARGKANGNPQHDASRSTAWAVVSALEFHRPQSSRTCPSSLIGRCIRHGRQPCRRLVTPWRRMWSTAPISGCHKSGSACLSSALAQQTH